MVQSLTQHTDSFISFCFWFFGIASDFYFDLNLFYFYVPLFRFYLKYLPGSKVNLQDEIYSEKSSFYPHSFHPTSSLQQITI